MGRKDSRFEGLPESAERYIRSVVMRIRMSLKVRREVCDELIDHFEHALRDCGDADRDQRAQQLIEQFGKPRLLARLIRRGKKRCRPLWKKAIIRSFQAAGLLFVFSCLYTWYLTTGEPTISVDYLSIVNQRRRPPVPDDQNAWKHYENAMDLYVEPARDIEDLARLERKDGKLPRFAELDPSQQAAIRKWVKDNEAAWAELEAGSLKPHCWYEYRVCPESQSEPLLLSIRWPPFYRLGMLARNAVWRSQIAQEEERIRKAAECCLAVVHVGRHLSSPRGGLIEQVFAMGVNNDAHLQMLRIVASPDVTVSQLGETQEQLAAIYPDGYSMVDIEFERVLFMDVAQHCYTEGGLGRGHLIPRRLSEFSLVRPNESTEKLDLTIKLYLGGMLLAGRDETERRANDFYRRANELIKLSPFQRRARDLGYWGDKYLLSLSEVRFSLLRCLLSSRRVWGKLAHRSKALHEATVTVLALRRWQMDKGDYPETLGELIDSGYLRAVPADPYSDGPLRYEKRGDDFVLYSVGDDFTDDRGVANPKYAWGEGHPEPGEPGGDRVFWPLN